MASRVVRRVLRAFVLVYALSSSSSLRASRPVLHSHKEEEEEEEEEEANLGGAPA